MGQEVVSAWSDRVFVMAAEFLIITEKTGMVNLTVRFSVMKSW